MRLPSVVTCWTVLLVGTAAAVAAESPADLLPALNSTDEAQRIAAIDQLGQAGPASAEAVPALAKLLTDPSPLVKAHAAQALGHIGEPAKAVVSEIIALMSDADGIVRREALSAIRAIRPGPDVSVPLAIQFLQGEDEAGRMRALQAIADAGEEAVPFLVKLLEDEQGAYWACLVLRDLGPQAKAAVPALAQAVRHSDVGVRREAILALASIGPAAAEAAPALGEMLGDELLRLPATFALGAIRSLPEAVEEQVKANTENADPALAAISSWVLARLHGDDPVLVRTAVERLAGQLVNENPRVRAACALGLLVLAPGHEAAVEAIGEALNQAKPETLDAVLTVLAGAGEKALPLLIKALDIAAMRPQIAGIIARLGPQAAPAVAALQTALGDENPATRNEVLFALAAIGPSAEPAVPAIAEKLDDPDENVRLAAVYALGSIGRAAAAAKPQLLKGLEAEEPFPRMASAWALALVDPADAETAAKTVPLLVGALQEPEPMRRIQAAAALKSLGPAAKDALPALKALSEDSDAHVREAATEAVQAISAEAAPAAELQRGDFVVASADEVQVKLGDTEVVRVPKGTELKVLEVRGAWIGVRVDVGGETKSGWVRRREIQPR